ncbi:MAG: hypothetical protein HKN45_07020 [Flavobacteriales bacterium]|nr:hypothetical protein [Flavobacteriales bacterium]
MEFRFTLFIFLISITTNGLIAQDYLSVVDSLEQVLSNTEDEDTRLKLLSDCYQHSLFNDLDLAYEYVVRFEKEAIAYGDSSELARSKNFFGMHASIAGDHFRAIAAYEEAQEWYEALRDTFMIGMMLNNIGGAYEFQADRENSIRFFRKASEYFTAAGKENWVFFTKFNLAGQYLAVDRLLEAEPLLEESVVYFQDNGYISYAADAYMSLADIAFKVESPMRALELMNKINQEDGLADKSTRARFEILLCIILSALEEYQEAGAHCDKGVELAEAFGAQNTRIDAHEAKYEFLKKTAQYEEALRTHELILSLNDSVVNAMKDKELVNMLTKYEIREKEKELQSSNLLLNQRTRSNQLIIVFSGILLLVAVVFIISRVRTNRKLTHQNELIEKSLSEKELLLREIHHRVKNNLQVVSSILSIQSRDIKDEEALKAVNESRSRVRSMALIHQDLYGEENMKGINAQSYITKLSNSLFNSYRVDKDKVKLFTEIDDLLIDVDTSVPLGLILNELVTNSLKYAFPDEREGEIHVELKEVKDSLRLTVADNGIGIPDDKKAASEDSFGMKMIKAFSKKLDAKWEVISDKGTTVKLVINNYKLAT